MRIELDYYTVISIINALEIGLTVMGGATEYYRELMTPENGFKDYSFDRFISIMLHIYKLDKHLRKVFEEQTEKKGGAK